MKGKIITAFITGGILGIILGSLITGFVLNLSGGNLMIPEIKSPYDFEKTVDVIRNRINSHPGWHVVTIYDQNEEVVRNGGQPIGKLKIIKFCNGKYASQVLQKDYGKKISAMLPKSIAVYEKSDGSVYISTANGAIISKLFGGDISRIMEKVSLEVEDIMKFVNFKFKAF